MRQFTYTIHDPLGIHARPAGMLARLAKGYASTEITLTKGGKTVKVSQLMKLMAMGVKNGDQVTVAAQGEQEDQAIEALEAFFQANF